MHHLRWIEANKEVEKPTTAENPEALASNSGYEANDLFPNKEKIKQQQLVHVEPIPLFVQEATYRTHDHNEDGAISL